MKPSEALARHREQVREIVRSHHGANPRVFGSVARGDDHDASDLDLLVDPTDSMTLFDMGAIIDKVGMLLGVDVDLVTAGALQGEKGAQILASARAL